MIFHCQELERPFIIHYKFDLNNKLKIIIEMVSIYCIQDCDGLKYVGSTTMKLNIRLSEHKTAKKLNRKISSQKLNLDKCEIYLLETCDESNRKEREKYWINEFDTVNERKLNGRDMEHRKEYHKEYYKNNKEKKKEFQKEYDLFRRKKVVNGCYEFIKMLDDY